jgi:AraC-like DNA-binding protein
MVVLHGALQSGDKRRDSVETGRGGPAGRHVMGSNGAGFQPLHFSTEHLPEQDRVGLWREVFGRSVLRLDIEPLPGVPFSSDLKVYPLPGLTLVSAAMCGMREQRTRELTADGNDSIGFAINLSGPFIASRRGDDVVLGPGDAILASCADLGTFTRPSFGRAIGFCMPRAGLAAMLPNVEDMLTRAIPCGAGALGLLSGYLASVMADPALGAPEFQQLAVTHIYDLVALMMGASRDVAAVAEGRGARAARLSALKADINKNLGSRELTIDAVAARHRITPRYIQRLFADDGTSFTDFVLGQRLARAHRLLMDPRYANAAVSAIAFEAGFGDLSYFNRMFRRVYGATPSDVRAKARHDAN